MLEHLEPADYAALLSHDASTASIVLSVSPGRVSDAVAATENESHSLATATTPEKPGAKSRKRKELARQCEAAYLSCVAVAGPLGEQDVPPYRALDVDIRPSQGTALGPPGDLIRISFLFNALEDALFATGELGVPSWIARL